MDNRINNFNNISMHGKLIVTTWKNMKPHQQEFITTKAQDRLVREFLKDKTECIQESSLSKPDSEFLHKLFEFFAGKMFGSNPGMKKTVCDYSHEIHVFDNGYKLKDGTEFILEL